MNNKLVKTQEEFLKNLPKRMMRIEELLDLDTLKSKRELRTAFDDLISLSGSMGFQFIYEAALRVREIITDSFYEKTHIVPILSLVKDYYKNLPHEHKDLVEALKSLDLGHKLQVLIVESNEITAFHLKKILSSSEISVTISDNGLDAFQKVVEKFYDLVITGINVGDLDGVSLIGAIKSLRKHDRYTKTMLIGPEEFQALPLSCVPDSIVFTDENFSHAIVENIEILFERKFEPLKECTIYFLDDDMDTLNLIETSFSKMDNFKISLCQSSIDLLKKMRANKPSLVVLDLMLGNESGLDVYQSIRKEFGVDIPIVFISAREEDFKGQEISKTDALGWIGKPFSPKSLANDILKLLELK